MTKDSIFPRITHRWKNGFVMKWASSLLVLLDQSSGSISVWAENNSKSSSRMLIMDKLLATICTVGREWNVDVMVRVPCSECETPIPVSLARECRNHKMLKMHCLNEHHNLIENLLEDDNILKQENAFLGKYKLKCDRQEILGSGWYGTVYKGLSILF